MVQRTSQCATREFNGLPNARLARGAEMNPTSGSYVSRAIARREIAGLRPGFWQQGQLDHPTPSGNPRFAAGRK